MNQILVTKNSLIRKKEKNNYIIVLLISISISFIILIYLFFIYCFKLNKIKSTNTVKSIYSLALLYSQNNNDNKYKTIKLSDDISIIGLIEIPKINISYPIFENINESLLKVSVCKFSGPFPNQTGNLCIAGHNYKNSLMFSKLDELSISDSIFLTDLNNEKIEYVIYDKFKVKQNNLECTANTNNTEITLITCNSINNSERIIIKAKKKGS